MASHERRPTSLSEKLSAGFIAIRAATKALFNSLTDASAYKPYNWPFRRIFVIKLLRQLGPLQRASYGQSLSPTTGEAVRSNCKKNQWPLESHLLSCQPKYANATLHEIKITTEEPEPTTRRAFLFFHGGGYLNALSGAAHMPAAHEFAKTLDASHLFVLEYSLSPSQTYPTQLAQAVTALAKLLTDFNFTPEQIVLGGDSAGGNLVFALLAHLIQPHPDCPAINTQLMQGEKFKGALCISPWVTMQFDTASCKDNEEIDLLSNERMAMFTELFKPKSGHVWADMLVGDVDFWAQIPVRRVLLTAGSLEMFRDDVVTMGARLSRAKENGTDVKLVVAEGEIHDQTALDFALGTKHSQTTVAIYEWCLNIAKGL